MPSVKEFKLKEKTLKAQAKEIADARSANRAALYQEILSRFEELERRNEVQLRERLRWGCRYYSTNFEFYVSSTGDVSCTYKVWANHPKGGWDYAKELSDQLGCKIVYNGALPTVKCSLRKAGCMKDAEFLDNLDRMLKA